MGFTGAAAGGVMQGRRHRRFSASSSPLQGFDRDVHAPKRFLGTGAIASGREGGT